MVLAPDLPLVERVQGCGLCSLCVYSYHGVPGVGAPRARLMLVGDTPGGADDRRGVPFVGPAGDLLTRMLAAIGLRRADVYLTHVVKCHTHNGRRPKPAEIEICLPYLAEEIAAVDPAVILLLGQVALEALIDPRLKLREVRGQWFPLGDRWMIPTWHPAQLLRREEDKKTAWLDWQAVATRLDLPLPGRRAVGS